MPPAPAGRDRPPESDDVTCWIADAGRGDAAAQARIWDRYFGQLVDLARHRLAPKATRPTRSPRSWAS